MQPEPLPVGVGGEAERRLVGNILGNMKEISDAQKRWWWMELFHT